MSRIYHRASLVVLLALTTFTAPEQASAGVVFNNLHVPLPSSGGFGLGSRRGPGLTFAQQFIMDENEAIRELTVRVGKEGSVRPGPIYFEIWSDSGSDRPGAILDYGDVGIVPDVSKLSAIERVTMETAIFGLTPQEKYWIVLDFEGTHGSDGSNDFGWGTHTSSTGTNGATQSLESRDWGTTWTRTSSGSNYFSMSVETGMSLSISGGGETYEQDFDGMGAELAQMLPPGWKADTSSGGTRRVGSLGLSDDSLGSLNPGDSSAAVVNAGGNARLFRGNDEKVKTWWRDMNSNGKLDDADMASDDNTDRALGISRPKGNDLGILRYDVQITDFPLHAFTLDWDLEIWGGDPKARFRGDEGGGFTADVTVGNTSYYNETKTFKPGELFNTKSDGADVETDSTLIDGNVHSIRGISSEILEVSAADGAVGNMINLTFDANYGGADKGWISAIDNVRLRALAPGDADANGVVDVADLLQLLGGQKFNQGVSDVTWAQGDFNADDQFNTGDLLAMLSFLSGTFPSDPYASEAGASRDAVTDVIVNSETGEVTIDLAGHTVSAIIIESAANIFNGEQPEWDTTSQFPSTLPGELGNVLFTSTASGVDELGAVISQEFLGRDKDFYLQDLDLNILIASDGGALTKGNVIVVPEPSTWMLFGMGNLALMAVLRRRLAG